MIQFDISNTHMAENDMSKSDEYAYTVLLYIIQKGEPTAAYEIAKVNNMPQPTVRNICNKFKQEGILTEEKGSRNKLMFAPTWHGLSEICSSNQNMQKEIDVMLDGWFNQPQFIESLKEEFGEVVTKNPDYAKALVKKMIKYLLQVEKEIPNITEEEYTLMEIVIAEQKLLEKNPVEIPKIVEFYKSVKFYGDNVDRVLRKYQENLEFWKLQTGRKRF